MLRIIPRLLLLCACARLSVLADTAPVALVIGATMAVGFDENIAELREPTPEELENFIIATANFYLDVLEPAYPDLDSFEATLVGSSLDDRRTNPLRIDFDATAVFDPDGTGIPSQEDLFDTMKAASNQTFVQQYVWPLDNLFVDANRAVFDHRIVNWPVPVTSSPTTDGTESPYIEDAVLTGDAAEECYKVERRIVRYPADETTGCIRHTVEYTYSYNFHQETLATVEAELSHGCSDGNDNGCTLSVDGVGTCAECTFYLLAVSGPPPPNLPPGVPPPVTSRYWSEVTIVDCSNLEGVFPVGEQKIELWSDPYSFDDYSYTNEFFALEDGGRCEEAPSRPPVDDSPEPSVSCVDQGVDGALAAGKCYAVDKFFCVEEWPDGCTRISAFYEYYNVEPGKPAWDRETYHFVEVKAVHGCDAEANPDQPTEGCSIGMLGQDCQQCSNLGDGDEVTMTECSSHNDVFDPPEGQAVSLLEEGSMFDVANTDEMCNHPAVTTSSDRNGPDNTPTKKTLDFNKAEKTKTLEVSLKLHFEFAHGKGSEPGTDAVMLLATNTIDFFKMVLLGDPTFQGTVVGLTMDDIDTTYSVNHPDKWEVDMKAKVEVDSSSPAKNSQAADVMANANLNHFVNHYVRKNRSGRRNALFHVRSLNLRAVSTAG